MANKSIQVPNTITLLTMTEINLVASGFFNTPDNFDKRIIYTFAGTVTGLAINWLENFFPESFKQNGKYYARIILDIAWILGGCWVVHTAFFPVRSFKPAKSSFTVTFSSGNNL